MFFWATGGYAEATEGQADCIGYGYAVEAPALLNRQCNRVQGWRCFVRWKSWHEEKTEAAKGYLKKLEVTLRSFCTFLVEDAPFSQRKLLMSLKELTFVGMPNSASSLKRMGVLGNLAIFPLQDWKVWNTFQNLNSSRWRRTMWQCVVLNSWATKDTLKCFNSKLPWAPKTGQFFTEMKYLASRQLWNLQTLKPPDTNSWVVPSTCLKFRNRDLCCTIHRNKPRLQYISSIRIHGKWNDLLSSYKSVENHLKITVWDMKGQIHTWPFGKLRTWRQFSHFLAKECFIHKKILLETRNCEAATSMKSVSSCLCAVQISSPCTHALRLMLKKSSFVVRKASISRFYIRSCHMLLKPKVVFKNCCNKTLIW